MATASQPSASKLARHIREHPKKRGACEGAAFFMACGLEVQADTHVDTLLGEVVVLANVVAGP